MAAAEPGPSEPGSSKAGSSTGKDEEVSLVQTSLGHQIGIKRKAVSLDRPNTSSLFSSDAINYLIYRYLEENGFHHTAYIFGSESNVYSAQFDPNTVVKGALVKTLQKGVFFAEAERFKILAGDSAAKFEETAGSISLLEAANPLPAKKACGVIDPRILAGEAHRLRKARRKDQITLLKQQAEMRAQQIVAARVTKAEQEQQQMSVNKAQLKQLREKEHEREKDTKESERKEKAPPSLNGIQPPGHIKVKMEQNKRLHSATPPSTSQQMQQMFQQQQVFQQQQHMLQQQHPQPSSSRHDMQNHIKESTPLSNKQNHMNNMHPHPSSIGISQPQQAQHPQLLAQQQLLNFLNPQQLGALMQQANAQGGHPMLPGPNGGFANKDIDQTVFLKLLQQNQQYQQQQQQQSQGNGTGNPQQQSGAAIAHQQLQLLHLQQHQHQQQQQQPQPLPQQPNGGVSGCFFILDPGLQEHYGFCWNPRNTKQCALGFAFSAAKIFNLPLEKPISQWTMQELRAKSLNLAMEPVNGQDDARIKDMSNSSEYPSCDWSSSGALMASATLTGTARIWNNKGKLMQTLNGHCAAIMGISFSPSGEKLFTIGMDRKVKIWETYSGKLLQTYLLRCVTDYHWLNDEIFACCSTEFEVYILRVGSDVPVRKIVRNAGEINSIRFDRYDSKCLAIAGDDRLCCVYDLNQDEPIARLGGHSKGIVMVRWSPMGRILATSGLDNQIIVRSVLNHHAHLSFPHSEPTYMMDFSPDGKFLACTTFDSKLLVYSLSTGNIITSLVYKSPFYNVSFDSTGDWVAASSQGTLVISDLRQAYKAEQEFTNKLNAPVQNSLTTLAIGVKT